MSKRKFCSPEFLLCSLPRNGRRAPQRMQNWLLLLLLPLSARP